MRDIAYQHECAGFETCNGRYVRETSDSINERTGEHQDNCRLKRKDSAHYKHNLEKHHGEQQEIKVMVLGKCPNDPTLGQCMESVVIAKRSFVNEI